MATRVELETLFPEGVRFKESGCPDFTPYAIKEVVLEGLTGKRKSDGRRATAEFGLISKPDDYTWHHVEGRYNDAVNTQKIAYRSLAHRGSIVIKK